MWWVICSRLRNAFQSNGQSSRSQRPGDAGFDFFMVDQLAAIGLLNLPVRV
jgi:hypothetical protein